MNWKVGDEFIITGPDEELDSYALKQYKNTRRVIINIDESSVYFANPVTGGTKENMLWYCPIVYIKKLTKLERALR